MSDSNPPHAAPPTDSPILSSVEDELGRAIVAHDFAASIRELDASQGLVIGILGSWGHGKSSFINLMKEHFETEPKLTVIDFNPWMFSGSEQLVNFFFTEIGAELKIRNSNLFARTADWFAKYASVLKPVSQMTLIPGAGLVGEVIAATAQGVADTTSANQSVSKLRGEITAELSELNQPIVVVIDDIDRLTKIEIREIFKLVRLTASFPNIIYLLAFDRKLVEQALRENDIPGREYLEKIVQLSFDVPKASPKLLRTRALSELDRIIAPVTNASPDITRWGDVYWEVIDPLFSNIRDVKRFAISCRATIKNLAGEIDLVDLLAMEAIRVFRPELFNQLSKLRIELTSIRNFARQQDDRKQKAVENLIELLPEDIALIRALFKRIFPAALQYIENNNYGEDWLRIWRLAHRMAHVDYLNMYFERVAPDELLAFQDSERAFTALEDAQALTAYFSSLKKEELETVIEGLTTYEDKFTPDMVVPGSLVLLNLIDAIPVRENRGIFDISRPDMTVGRVVLRLLRRIEEESKREMFVTQIIERVDTYSSQLLLLNLVGNREGVGNNLVSEKFAEQLDKDFANRLQNLPPSEPSREWDAWRIYYKLQEHFHEPPLTSQVNPVLLRMVFLSSKTTSQAQMMDSRSVKTEDRLAWDILLELFGTDVEIQNSVNAIRKRLGEDEVIQLADKYLSGWRPQQTFPTSG